MLFIKRNRWYHASSKMKGVLLGLYFLLSMTTTVYAQTDAGPFREGSGRMTLLIGGGTAYENNIQYNYTILGVGAGYYVVDGLEVGLDVEDWLGNGPRIYRVSPELHYVFYAIDPIKPYAGVFYRRNFIEGHDDVNSVGFRAGGLFLMSKRSYLGAGVVYDKYLNCSDSPFSSCSDTYPEIIVAVTF
jgi:hypothetical protein